MITNLVLVYDLPVLLVHSFPEQLINMVERILTSI